MVQIQAAVMDTLPVFKQILVDKGMLEEDKRSPAQKEKDAKKKVTWKITKGTRHWRLQVPS